MTFLFVLQIKSDQVKQNSSFGCTYNGRAEKLTADERTGKCGEIQANEKYTGKSWVENDDQRKKRQKEEKQ